MTQAMFLSIAATGFAVAFAHAAIPTHWLPFVLAGRGQRWSKPKTIAVVALCGLGHVGFTTLLGVLVVWLGIEMSQWSGEVFKWIAGAALIGFGIFYLVRQARGGGHGHSHSGADAHAHAHGAHGHGDEAKRIDTGHSVLTLEIFEDGVPPRFRLRDERGELPQADTVSIETLRSDGARQVFGFAARDGFLESLGEIPEPHEFTATLNITHGGHAHTYDLRFVEHAAAAELGAPAEAATTPPARSDGAVIASLFALLTFSPCEGFLPVYLSGVQYGWMGFFLLSGVLAVATIGGMIVFTWATLSGMDRLRLGILERYESGILGALILLLGIGIIFFGF